MNKGNEGVRSIGVEPVYADVTDTLATHAESPLGFRVEASLPAFLDYAAADGNAEHMALAIKAAIRDAAPGCDLMRIPAWNESTQTNVTLAVQVVERTDAREPARVRVAFPSEIVRKCAS